MKTIMQWARGYLALPAGMVLLAAAATGAYQAGEADPGAYKMLSEQWPQVSTNLKSQIADAMQDDRVSRWESVELARNIMAERRFLSWTMQTGTLEQERARLQAAIGKGQLPAGS